eukprot:329947-Amphidinium_carterae.1
MHTNTVQDTTKVLEQLKGTKTIGRHPFCSVFQYLYTDRCSWNLLFFVLNGIGGRKRFLCYGYPAQTALNGPARALRDFA